MKYSRMSMIWPECILPEAVIRYIPFASSCAKIHDVKNAVSAQAQAGGARGPAWSRFGELFLALLHLMVDPAACHLSLDLQVAYPSQQGVPESSAWLAFFLRASGGSLQGSTGAGGAAVYAKPMQTGASGLSPMAGDVVQAALQAALGAFQDSMWERRFADLAAGAASAGCSPGGALAAIRAFPASCQRGRLLQRHALAALLRRAIPGRVGPSCTCLHKTPTLASICFMRGPIRLRDCLRAPSML